MKSERKGKIGRRKALLFAVLFATLAFVSIGCASAAVVINEFVPNPEGADNAPMPGGEWIELYNMGDTDVNVSGWVLYDSDDTHELYITPSNTNTGNTIVHANGWLVVYRDGDADFSLNNDGDEVRLYNGYPPADSTLIDETNYTGSTEGKSWARIPDGIGDWQEADPTPGEANGAVDTTPPTIEFMPPTPENDTTVCVNYVNVTVNVSDNSNIATVLLNWNAENMTLYNIAPGIFSLNNTNLINGLYTYKVYSSDTYNNWGVSDTRVVTVNVTINQLPIVTNPSAIPYTIPDDTDNNPTCSGTSCSEISQLNVTVTDDSGVERVTIDLTPIGGFATAEMTNIEGDIWSIETNASAGSAGIHNLVVNATDRYGNHNDSTSITLRVLNNGDVNEGGAVTLYDAFYLARHVLGKPGFEDINEGVAEVSGDCALAMHDAMYLAKHVLGKPGFETLH